MRKIKNKNIFHILNTLYFVFWMSLYLTVPVYAYIDPATTAMLTQIIAGIFISAGVMFGVFRRKIIVFCKNLSVKRMQKKIERQNRKATDNNGNTAL